MHGSGGAAVTHCSTGSMQDDCAHILDRVTTTLLAKLVGYAGISVNASLHNLLL